MLERRQNGLTTAEVSGTSKGKPGWISLESCSSGLFGYSFSAQQSLDSFYSSISCLRGSISRQQVNKGNGSPRR